MVNKGHTQTEKNTVTVTSQPQKKLNPSSWFARKIQKAFDKICEADLQEIREQQLYSHLVPEDSLNMKMFQVEYKTRMLSQNAAGLTQNLDDVIDNISTPGI